MDENTKNGAEQEAQPAGVEAQAAQAAETVAAETQPTAGAAKPEPEPKNDTETEHAPAGAKPDGGTPAPGAKAGEPANGAAPAEGMDPAAQLVVANQKITSMAQTLLTAKAEAKAAALGVKPERLKHAVRMAELGGIDPMADDADGKIGEKLQAIVTEMPELLGGTGTGASGAFRRQENKPVDPFEKGFKQG